jgi:HSP20 family protein
MNVSVHATEDDRISTLARQMSKWVDQVLGKGFHCSAEAWTPAINFYEGEDYYCVVVELAGINPGEIDMRVENGSLVVSGQRPSPGLPQGCRAIRLLMMEIDHGNFCRSIKLPPDVVPDKVSASYRSGYLWIRLPKEV